MPRTLQPLSLGKLLDETFDIYRHHWLLFISISAVPNIVLLSFQLIWGLAVTPHPKTADVLDAFATLTGGIASWLVTAVVTAATTLAVSDIYLDNPTSVSSCFRRVKLKAFKVAVVSLLVSLIVGLGLVLCIAPGIYWSGLYGIAVPAAVLENASIGESMNRSSRLARGSVGRIIVIYFLTSIFAIITISALDVVVELVVGKSFHGIGFITKEALQQIATTAAETLFGPITAIGLTLAYYDQRVRKEAFDIDHMMRLILTPGIAAGSSPS